MTTEITAALAALEQLSSSTSTSSSGPLNALLEQHFQQAKDRILAGDSPKAVITELQKNVTKAKKDVEKGLKAWYSSLGNVGKAIDSGFPPTLSNISASYDDPALFSSPEEATALNWAVLRSMGRQGLWTAVEAFQEETGQRIETEELALISELYDITDSIDGGDITLAVKWCDAHKEFLKTSQHPNSLPFLLHETIFSSLPAKEAILYARENLMPFVATHSVLPLLASALYRNNQSGAGAEAGAGTEIPSWKFENLSVLFREEFCRLHGWPAEDPLEVVVDLGSRGGALNAVEKARKVIGQRLGDVRSWDELPMEIPLPASRRYHSVFVCPVAKEQATEDNPPMMLVCGHTVAAESLKKMMKPGNLQKTAKCPYCPVETAPNAAQRLYL